MQIAELCAAGAAVATSHSCPSRWRSVSGRQKARSAWSVGEAGSCRSCRSIDGDRAAWRIRTAKSCSLWPLDVVCRVSCRCLLGNLGGSVGAKGHHPRREFQFRTKREARMNWPMSMLHENGEQWLIALVECEKVYEEHYRDSSTIFFGSVSAP